MIDWFRRLPARVRGEAPADQVAALPWRQGPDGLEVLLITSRETRRWIIPKGWPMEDRTDFGAAAQEALEEAGAEGDIDSRSLGRFRYGKRLKDGRVRPCTVEVYPLRVTRLLETWPEQAQRTRRWVTPAEAARAVEEPDLRDLLQRFRPAPGGGGDTAA